MLYGSEIWAAKEEDIHRLERIKMRMVRWMSNATLRDKTPSAELRNILGVLRYW